MPDEALLKEAFSTKDSYAANPHPDQLSERKDSGPLPWDTEPEVDHGRQGGVESLLGDLKPKGPGETQLIRHRASYSNDVINYSCAPSWADLNDGLSENEHNLPKTRSVGKELSRRNSIQNTANSPDKKPKDFQKAHAIEKNRGKGHIKRAEPRVRRRSSHHTENSNTSSDELLRLSSDIILKKARERIKQCNDIPVALEHFLKSQNNPGYSMDDVVDIHDLLKQNGIMIKRILTFAKQAQEQRKLENRTVSDLEFLIENLGKCLDVLEWDFERFEITHMDAEDQQKTWEEMLLIFERNNSNPLLDHLQLTCSFGNELLASLLAGSVASHESDELKKILLDVNRMQQESSLSILPKRTPSSKASLRRPQRARRIRPRPSLFPYDSDELSSPDAENLGSKQRRRPGSRHGKTSQDQGVLSTTLAGVGQFSPTGAVNWLWICQVNIIPGYFATPWKELFSEDVCIGAISTILKGLDGLTDRSTRRYVETQRNCQDWIRAGNVTYPSYALNANGGAVVSGRYKPVQFAGFPWFLPPIELLHSYDHQVRRGLRHQHQQPSAIVDELAELMGLDTWLSFCGRTAPISDGPSNLLRTLPALAQRILSDFEYEFANLDRTTSTDGGFQLI